MQLGNRHSQHSFAQIPAVNMARSQFDRSFTVKDTFDFDYLVPIFVDEILPGDTINLNAKTFGRLATQIVPIMDNMYIDYFFFFVPNRLVWDNWEKFCGAQTDPGDSTDFTIPQVNVTAAINLTGSIWDKFGLPLPNSGTPSISANALIPRAYNLIWNEWFRDQNLQDSLVVDKDDGPDTAANYALRKRNKKRDYFTSGLPWPQKGTAVSIDLGVSAPVFGIGIGSTPVWDKVSGTVFQSDSTDVSAANSDGNRWATSSGNSIAVRQDPADLGNPNIYADLTDASAITVNALREAIMVQSLLELDARGGTRYVEILQNHFNVTSPDFRLQRPEYLGGGSTTINSHPVAQTAPTSGSDPQAQLAAYATTSTQDQNIGFTKSFVEHGHVIGLACARADITYQQGVNKMWSRRTRFEYFWPKLQELGEQAVYLNELYYTDPGDETIICYQERHAEYRYYPSQIKGLFRSKNTTPLDFWHLAQEFDSAPGFNSTFIEQDTPIERAIAINTEPHLLMDIWFQYKHARPMMTYAVPATLGRF